MPDFVQSPWVQRIAFSLGGLLLGYLVERLVVERAHRLAVISSFKWDDLLVGSLRGLPAIWLGAGGAYFALSVGDVPDVVVLTVSRVLMVVIIGSIVVGGMRLAGGAIEMLSTTTSGAIGSPTLVVNLARGMVLVLGLFIILQNLGINITPLITALGIGGLAVALAFQDTLGNLFAGVHIILARQVRPHDYIQLSSGEAGWVTDVKARNTTIQTFPDGNLVAVPNSVLASSIVKNFSLPHEALWVSVDVGVSYGSDLEHVERVTREVAEARRRRRRRTLPPRRPRVTPRRRRRWSALPSRPAATPQSSGRRPVLP
ncbi:MAG: mechanosensitive ion channel family protein [Gemmatimonadetes bacterium]|nr:mechanosensitive ion channel family protein [Gemmatimonadota bacterium]MDA1101979.1 mechanosensitive ion channel family protein [Gemmatimonadota bacterium]